MAEKAHEEKALERIRDVAKTKATELDLSFLRLASLPF